MNDPPKAFPYGDPGPEPALLVTPSARDVTLQCRLVESDEALTISYVLVNRTGEEIYVYNRPEFPPTPGELLPARFGEVCHDDVTGVVNVIVGLSARLFLISAHPRDPFPSRVRAGGTVADVIRVPIPIREWNAYYGSAESQYIAVEREVSQVRFIVDFVRRSAKGFSRQEPLTSDTPLWVNGRAESAWCLLSLSQPVKLQRRLRSPPDKPDTHIGDDLGWTRRNVPAGGLPQRRGTLATWTGQ